MSHERVREQGGRLIGWALGASVARRVLAQVNVELERMESDGSELRLPAVTFATLPLLTAASGGRVPNPYQ